MDDTRVCPICNVRLNSISNLVFSKKDGTFTERTCSKGKNHFFIIFVNEQTQKVDRVKISLNPEYSIFFEVNYSYQICIISCFKNGKMEHNIEIPRIIEPDFPDLAKLKEKIGLYVVFS